MGSRGMRIAERLFAALVAAMLAAAALLTIGGCTSPWEGADGTLDPGTVQVRYYGHSMVAVSDRLHTVVVDPFQEHAGFPVPDVSADLVLISRDRLDHNNRAAVRGSPKVFDEPGLFVLGELRVIGIPSRQAGAEKGPPNVIYSWKMEDIGFAHFGDLASPELSDEAKLLLTGADVMFCPIGGGVTLDASGAAAVVKELSPRVVIPIRYKTGPSALDIAELEDFTDRMPNVRTAPSTIRVRVENLPEPTQVWVMDWR